MRTSRWFLLLSAIGLGTVLAACESDDGPTPPCLRDTGDATVVGDVTVVYSATVTGDAEILSLTYNTESGPQTIGAPTLPFHVTVQPRMTPARIRATGITGSGSFTIGYRISALGTGTVEDETRLTCP
jgi:hypothetical protein